MATSCPCSGPSNTSALYTVPKAPLESLLTSLYFYILRTQFDSNNLNSIKIQSFNRKSE